MAIKVGDKIPSVKLKHMTADGIKDITTDEIFKGKKVVLFAVPGAFTPTCSAKHLPGFVQNAEAFKAKGVDTIACIAVNDAFCSITPQACSPVPMIFRVCGSVDK